MLSFFRMRGNKQDSKQSSKRADRRRLDGLFSRNLRIESLEDRQLLSISPTIGAVSVNKDLALSGETVEISVSGLADADSTTTGVWAQIYDDTNNNGIYDSGDTSLGGGLATEGAYSLTHTFTNTSGVGQTHTILAFAVSQNENGAYEEGDAISAKLTVFPTSYTAISDLDGLKGISSNLSGKYYLTGDIDATTIGGFTSLGNFSGVLDGNGHTISNLDASLFNSVNATGVVKNLGLISVAINRDGSVGGFAVSSAGTISNCYVQGYIVGYTESGPPTGLFVALNSGVISDCYAEGSIRGRGVIGGFVGENVGALAVISNCHAAVEICVNNFNGNWVTGDQMGGFVGINSGGSSIKDSYSTGSVDGGFHSGGFVGQNSSASISGCFATGNAAGNQIAGGFVGQNDGSGYVVDCYATGNASGEWDIGGFVGLDGGGAIDNCFATGHATASLVNSGGFVGEIGPDAMISDSFSVGSVDAVLGYGGLFAGMRYYPSNIKNCYYSSEATTSIDFDNNGDGISSASLRELYSSDSDIFDTWSSAVWSFSDYSTPLLIKANDVAENAAPIAFNLTADKDWVKQTSDDSVALTFSGFDDKRIVKVLFYNDANGDGVPVASELLGTDAAGSDGWKLNVKGTSFSTTGSRKILAVAVDESGAMSSIVSTKLSVFSSDYTAISTANQLLTVTSAGQYFLTCDIDLAAAGITNFTPIANFAGAFDGNGHVIKNLTISQTTSGVGLFAEVVSGSVVRNLGLTNVSVVGGSKTGGLVGQCDAGAQIINCYVTGSISSTSNYVGGLIGYNYGTVSKCYTRGTVTTSANWSGGLIGYSTGTSAVVSLSCSSASVSGSYFVGGFIGSNAAAATVTNSYATGNVNGNLYIGGFIGSSGPGTAGTITACYATGTVTGTGNSVGGFIGYSYSGTITYCFAIGNVTGTASSASIGAFIGLKSTGTTVSNCVYNSAAVITNHGTGGTSTITGTAATTLDALASLSDYENGIYNSWTFNTVLSLFDNYYDASFAWYMKDGLPHLCATESQSLAAPTIGTFAESKNWIVNSTDDKILLTLDGVTAGDANLAAVRFYYYDAVGALQYLIPDMSGSDGFSAVISGSSFTAGTYTIYAVAYDVAGNASEAKAVTLTVYPAGYTAVSTVEQLQAIQNNLGGNYFLTCDIDASATALWNYDSTTGTYRGFTPIGYGDGFTGTFSGNGHVISNLYVNYSNYEDSYDVGLFSFVGEGGKVERLRVENANISGDSLVGIISGECLWGTISDCFVSGCVRGANGFVGGITGWSSGVIQRCRSAGTVDSNAGCVGGLVGEIGDVGTITDSYSTASASGTTNVGGLVGLAIASSAAHNCYATGSVFGTQSVGGFIGHINGASVIIDDCYSTGYVSGNSYIGGFIGYCQSGSVTDCFSLSDVTGNSSYARVGGFAGVASSTTGTITNCYYLNVATITNNGVGGINSYVTSVALDSLASNTAAVYTRSGSEWNFSGASASWTLAGLPRLNAFGEVDDNLPSEVATGTLTLGRDSRGGAMYDITFTVAGAATDKVILRFYSSANGLTKGSLIREDALSDLFAAGTHSVSRALATLQGSQYVICEVVCGDSVATAHAFASAPAAPTNLQVTALSDTSVSLSWTDNAVAGSGYVVERSTDGVHFYRTIDGFLPANSSGCTISGLTAGTTYSFRVIAYEVACSAPSTAAEISLVSTLHVTDVDFIVDSDGRRCGVAYDVSGMQSSSVTIEASLVSSDGTTYSYWTTTDSDVSVGSHYNENTPWYVNMDIVPVGEYDFVVTVSNGVTSSSYSSHVSAPQALTSLSATVVSDTEVTLSWTLPSWNGVSPTIDAIMLEGSADGVNYRTLDWNWDPSSGSETLFFPDGLVYFRARAYSLSAESSSTYLCANTLNAKLDLSNFSYSGESGLYSLAYQVSDAISGPITINVYRSANGASTGEILDSYVFSASSLLSVGSHSVTFAPAANIDAVDGALIATISNGQTNSQATTNVVAQPTSLAVTATSTSVIHLAWTDNSYGESGFEIQRSLNGVDWTPLISRPANTLSYDDQNLTEGTKYYYRVRATSATENSAYCASRFATTYLNAPTDLSVSSISVNQVSLQWNYNSTQSTSYVIEQLASNGDWFAIGTSTSSSATISPNSPFDLTKTNKFRVYAVVGDLTSPPSNVATVKAALCIRHWTGSAGSNLWSVAENWSNGVPQAGDVIEFDNACVTYNDLSAGTVFDSIKITANNVKLEGNEITLNSGISLSAENAQSEISLNVTIANSAAFEAAKNSGLLMSGGIVANASSLTKSGDGLLTLANGLSGHTVQIDAGTLKIGAASVLTSLSLSNGGILDLNGFQLVVSKITASSGSVIENSDSDVASIEVYVNQNTTNVFAGSIKVGQGYGEVALTKSGGGTLVLSGKNESAVATTVAGGTLQVGNEFGNGSIVGNIVNNATLKFQTTLSQTYDGVISGSGSLIKSGTGTLILTAVHSFTGETTISQGTLQIGDGLTTGSVLGAIVNNGVLTLFPAGDISFANAVSGTGSLKYLGTGTITFNSANTYTYTGYTEISSGSMNLVGTISNPSNTSATGDVLVRNAELVGNGSTSHGVTIDRGGVLNPIENGSPTTISVGDLVLNAGAVLKTTVNRTGAPYGPFGQVVVTGRVTIYDAELTLLGDDGDGSQLAIVIIQNDGTDSVQGRFGQKIRTASGEETTQEIAEGSAVNVNYVISYCYNAETGKFFSGNDVALIKKDDYYAALTFTTPASVSYYGGVTAYLSVGASSRLDASDLIYTWEVVSKPAGAADPQFSVNASSSSYNSTVSLFAAGEYKFRVSVTSSTEFCLQSEEVTLNVEQVASSISVDPQLTIVPSGGTQQFSAIAYDQFGDELAVQPTFTWSANEGTVTQDGLWTAPSRESNSSGIQVTATCYDENGSRQCDGAGTVYVTNSRPEIDQAAKAEISADGRSATLSVLGKDDAGEGLLTYSWTAVALTPGASTPSFSNYNDNLNKSITASFSSIGTYRFIVTIKDAGGLATMTDVVVTVSQNLTSIAVQSFDDYYLTPGASYQLEAVGYDQFGHVMASAPACTWTSGASDYFTVDSSGLMTVSDEVYYYEEVTVTATASGGVTASKTFTAYNSVPEISVEAVATMNADGVSATLTVLGSDDSGESNLTYSWNVGSQTSNAATPTFADEGTNGAKNTTVTFYGLGSYSLQVTVTDKGGVATYASVTVDVTKTLTTVSFNNAPNSVAANGSVSLALLYADQFGNTMTASDLSDSAVTWRATAGSISADGTYYAPNASMPVTITAEKDGVSVSKSINVVVASPTTSARTGDSWMESYWEAMLGSSGTSGTGLQHYRQITGQSVVTVNGGSYSVTPNSVAAPGAFVLTTKGNYSSNTGTVTTTLDYVCTVGDSSYSVRETDASSLTITATLNADNSWTYLETYTLTYGIAMLSGTSLPHAAGSYTYTFSAYGSASTSYYTCTVVASMEAAGSYVVDGVTGDWTQTVSNSDTISYTSAGVSRSGSGSTTANSVLGGETYSPSNSYQYAIYYALSSGTWTASGSASNVKALSQTSNSTGDDTTDGITQSWTKFDASSYRYQSNYSYAGTATTGAWTMTSGGGSSSGSGSGSSEYFGGGSYSYSASGGTISGGYSKSGNNASVYSYQATATWSSASGWSQSGSKTVANSGEQYYSYSGAGMYADSSTDDDQSYSVSGVQSENGSDHEIYSETDSYALASDGTWAFVNSVSWTAGNGYGYSAYSGAGQYAYSDSSQSMSGTFSENGYDRRVYNYDGRTSSAVETISGEDSYSYSGSGSYTSLKVSLLDEHDVIQSFSGALSESGSTWESFNENNSYSQSNGNWILQSGVGVSSGSGSSHSSYSGSGSYVHYDYAFYNSTDNDYDVMRGDFAESGSEDSSYNYNLNGTAIGGVWSYSGSQTNTSGGQSLFSAHASGKVDSSWNNYSATGTRSENCNADDSYSFSLYYKANAANGDWESSGGTGFSAGGGYRYQTLSASGDYSASGNYYNSKIAGKFSFGSGSGYSYSYDTDSSYSDGEWTTSGSGTESLYGSSRSDYSGSGSYTRSNWRGDGTTTGTLAESGHAGETYSYVKNYDIESDGSWRETNGTGGSSGSGFTYSQYSGEGDYSSTVYGSSCEGAVTENGWEGSSYSFKTEAKFNNGYWKESGSKTASGSGHSWRDFDGTGAFSNSQLGSGFDLNGTVDENGWDETNFISKKEYALDLNGDWQAASGSATASGSGLMHASYSASGAFSSMSVYYGEAQGNASASGFDDSSYNYSENYSLNITTDTWCGASGSGGTSGSGETHWSYVGSGSMTVNRYDIPVNGYQNYYWNGLSVPSNFTASGKDDSSYEYETTATCYRGNWSQSGSRAATASGSSSGSYSGTKSYTVAGWSGITGTMSASGDSSDSYYYTVGSKLRANGEWKDLTGSGSASGTGNDHWSYAESGNYSWSTSPYYYYGYYAGNSYTVSGSASASGHGDAHREYSTSSNLKVVDYWSHWITSGSATTTEEGGMNYSYSGSGSGAWSSHDEDSGDHYEWSRDDAADSAYSEKGSGDFTYYQRTVWTNKNDNWSVQSQVLSSSGSTHASTHFSAHASGSNYSYTEGYYGESEYNSDYRMSASSDLYYDGSFSEHVTRSRNSKGQLVTSGTSQESRHYSGSSDYDWADNNFGNSDSYYWYDSVESNNHSKFHENSDYDCIDTFVTTYDSDGNAVYSSTYDDYYHWGYSSSSWGSATYTYSNGEKDHTSYSNSYGDSWTSDGGYGWYWWGGYYYGYYSYYGRPSGSNPYGADVLTTCPNGLQNPAETNGSLHNGYFGGLGFSSATGVKSIVASEAGKALPLIPHGTGYYYYNFTACAPWLASYSVTTSSFAWLAPTTAANMTVNGGYVPWMARFDISTPRANKVPNLNNSVLKGNSDSAATAATAAAKSAAPGSSYSFGNGILASFDDAGNLIGLTDPTANETTWNYDDSNRVTSVSDELGNSKLYVYDDSDNLVRYTDANGRVTTYAFDAAGRVVSEVWYENATDADAELNAINSFSYVYDSQGRVLSESDNYSSIAYVYDPQGRKISVTQSSEGDPTVVFTYTYDDDNENPTSVAAMIDGVMDYVNYYAYDSNGKLTQIIQDCGDESNSIANKEVNISYDSAGNVVSIDRYELGSYVASSYYTYDSLGRLTGLTHRQGDTVLAYYAWTYASDDATAALETASQTADYFDLVSSYDANTIDLTNLVSDVSEAALIATCTSADGTATYAYDASGQVTGAGYSSGTLSDESYTYDANGNRTSGGYVIGADNRILSDGTYAYAYDAEGNRVAKFVDEDADGLLDAGDSDVTAYVWDNRDRLTEVVSYVTYGGAASQDVKYFYDVKNRLIREELDADGAGEAAATAKAFAYDGKQIALQFDGEADETLTRDDLSHRYLWNPQAVDQILADEQLTKIESGYDVTSPGTVVWPLTDNLGSVRDLAVQDAATGVTSVVNHRVYDVFGNLKSETNPATGLAAAVDSVFGFTGRLHDDATGLQNNLNRWYDSKTGSWTSKDPSSFNGGDANLYRYVGNSPLNATDPTGLWKIWGAGDVHETISLNAAKELGITVTTFWGAFNSSFGKGLIYGSEWTDFPDGYIGSAEALAAEKYAGSTYLLDNLFVQTADTHFGSTVYRHGMTSHPHSISSSLDTVKTMVSKISRWICDQYTAAQYYYEQVKSLRNDLKSVPANDPDMYNSLVRKIDKAQENCGLEIGKAMHTIADLYCPSHVVRSGYSGPITQFQDYAAQDVDKHAVDDKQNDYTKPFISAATTACREFLRLLLKGKSTSDVKDWLLGSGGPLNVASGAENGGTAEKYKIDDPLTEDKIKAMMYSNMIKF